MDIHIGEKINEVIKLRHSSKQEVGRVIGITGSTATYLTKKASIDVQKVYEIGKFLKYNFFKHYPIVEEGIDAETMGDEKDKKIYALNGRVAELEKMVSDLKSEMQGKENGYLKKINELLEKK